MARTLSLAVCVSIAAVMKLYRLMPQLDSTTALSQFLVSLPTFVAVIFVWMHSTARISGLENSLNRRIDDMRDLLRAEFRRVEQVMDARLKHLEEADAQRA